MNHIKLICLFVALLIIMSLVPGVAACGQSAPAATPSVSPSPVLSTSSVAAVTPASGITGIYTPTPSPVSTIVPTSSSALPSITTITPTSFPAPALTPSPSLPPTTEVKPAEITIATNKTSIDFPNSITFRVEGTSILPVNKITLEYGTNERSVVEQVTKVQLTFPTGTKINNSYTWDMKKTGSLPPKAEVWYQWRFEDYGGRTYITPRQSMVFDDSRYKWQLESTPTIDYYYHDQALTMIKDLISGVESNLSQIELDVAIPKERKIKVLVYNDYDEVRSSGLFKQEWTGGQAFPGFNIVIMAVNSGILEWAKGALPHEIIHLLVGEAIFGPFGEIPVWLNEGLAMYSEGPLAKEYQQVLDKAIRDKTLISLQSLSSQFPTDANQAYLAYAESNSFISYLIENKGGWENIRQLLKVFKEGSTTGKALLKVYGSTTYALEAGWRTYISSR